MANPFAALLTHTYTRTPITPGSADQWGINAQTPGNASTAEVCFYNPSERARIGSDGSVDILGPVLLVAANSVLTVGDQVSAIAGGGSTLESGPLTVDSLEELTLRAGILIKRAKLSRAETSNA